ncbi:hypothetical protein [Staphylococcus phage vB_SepM_ phiIPLA-C1C]|jgi:hypothetical protein|uniref:Uncharacterized protein n=4 Tax=Sepunavirus TaxID=1980928 RepID=A0A0D3MWN4_9CAUD|nr:hypothetical protein AVU40_gp147 [Staphylococcus phage phiIPLA-C1C]AXF38448.1 hypothetical protein Twillingate_012 [Staphylococcus phage Twillingate]AXY83896.1 hypothetical protein Terranova_013 [Staphylococcus phage Terranova]MDU7109360.1 hypothetical protein [Clostridium perfringens]QLF87192.1 hypothetical protein BESEP6_00184 [Staphylococcus phage vB_SepM_BE06]QLF87365.1 hypothetical protein BESEP7_00017 [Staphylococcus phage vB_SepM_BE07]QLF87649.1 hypothetical protein BESEP8_00101 [St
MTHIKVDKRKSLNKNIKENGLKKELNKNSGKIKIKESLLRKAKRNNDIEKINKLENELKKLYNQLD